MDWSNLVRVCLQFDAGLVGQYRDIHRSNIVDSKLQLAEYSGGGNGRLEDPKFQDEWKQKCGKFYEIYKGEHTICQILCTSQMHASVTNILKTGNMPVRHPMFAENNIRRALLTKQSQYDDSIEDPAHFKQMEVGVMQHVGSLREQYSINTVNNQKVCFCINIVCVTPQHCDVLCINIVGLWFMFVHIFI